MRIAEIAATRLARCCSILLGASVLLLALGPIPAQAIPLFARQTGQNCLACHAGGQFPMLTAYGRKFKLTGYTLGTRTELPIAAMVTGGATHVANTQNGTIDDPNGGGGNGYSQNDSFPKNRLSDLTVSQVSLFAGGKITDNIGLFGQWSWNPYANAYDPNASPTTHWKSHASSDQFDLRYADRFIDSGRDLIVGVSLNNNVGTTDVWNTFNNPYQIVPSPVGPSGLQGQNLFVAPPNTTFMTGGNVLAGVNAYAYWNDLLYGEVGFYRSANGVFSFMTQGIDDPSTNKLNGMNNPYWRFAINHDWGAHNLMVGTHGMLARQYSDPTDTTSPLIRYFDRGVDAQYQYNLAPHTFTAIASYTRETQSYDAALLTGNGGTTADNPTNTVDHLKLNATYVYQAKYGAALSYQSLRGTSDNTLYGSTAFTGSAVGSPNTKVWTPEVFWMPVQYLRVGLQYYKFTEFMGGTTAYDGTTSRNAKDNNMLFLYFWGAY